MCSSHRQKEKYKRHKKILNSVCHTLQVTGTSWQGNAQSESSGSTPGIHATSQSSSSNLTSTVPEINSTHSQSQSGGIQENSTSVTHAESVHHTGTGHTETHSQASQKGIIILSSIQASQKGIISHHIILASVSHNGLALLGWKRLQHYWSRGKNTQCLHAFRGENDLTIYAPPSVTSVAYINHSW